MYPYIDFMLGTILALLFYMIGRMSCCCKPKKESKLFAKLTVLGSQKKDQP